MHTHLKRDQRVALAALSKAGLSHRDIARELGVHHTTVGRELRRNSKAGTYHASHARVLARERRKNSKQKYRKIESDPVLATRIERMLHPLTSPEVVAHDVGLVHETFYAWIDRSRPDLRVQLPYHGKKRHRYGGKRTQKQGWTKNVRNIAERPKDLCSWEGDTVKGATKTQLLTHVERRSLFAVVDLIPNGTADAVHKTLKRHQKIKGSVTYDRGSEFALWQFIERDTDATVYFANAHHPWERGKNENTNGRLRRVFPKGFNFSTMRQGDIDRVVARMNHTKRKSLSWQTPCAWLRWFLASQPCCTSTSMPLWHAGRNRLSPCWARFRLLLTITKTPGEMPDVFVLVAEVGPVPEFVEKVRAVWAHAYNLFLCLSVASGFAAIRTLSSVFRTF